MNKEDFKQHLHDMFAQHYSYKERFTRGVEGGGNVENLLGGAEAMQSMLEEITSDVFENPEYQQGVANYNTIYSQAWDTYLDFVHSSGNESDPLWNSIANMRAAPGIYSGGELIQIPRMYTRRLGRRTGERSEYAKQWLRKKVGVSVDPEHAYAQQKAAEMRTGYGKDWTRNIRARILREEGRYPSDEEVETQVNALIDSKLGGQLAAARVRPNLPPVPETPLEVRLRHTSSMEGNIPLAYRTRVGRMLNTQYEGVNARSEKQIDKQFRFELKAEGNTDVGHSRVVKYSKKGKLMRNEYVEGAEPDKGVFVIEENPNDPTNALVHMVDFRTADEMLAALKDPTDPYFAPLMVTDGFFSAKMQTEVFAKTPTPGFEWQFYSQDQMVLLNNIVYPKLTAVMTVLKNNSITPADLADLDSWDTANGQAIRAHMDANPEMRDTWLNVLLVYCNGFEANAGEGDRKIQLMKKLGVIGEAPAAGDGSTGASYEEPPIPPEPEPDSPDAESGSDTAPTTADLINWKRYNEITSLTAEQAVQVATNANNDKSFLHLSGLTDMPPDVATALGNYEYQNLYLNGLRTISAESANALVSKLDNHFLYLNGITQIDKSTATALAQYKGQLRMDSLSSLTSTIATEGSIAEQIAQSESPELYLNAITTLDVPTATALSAFEGDRLHLNGLPTLDSATAAALAKYNGNQLRLGGLTELSTETATALKDTKAQYLVVTGVKSLSEAAREALKQSSDVTIVVNEAVYDTFPEADKESSKFIIS